MDSPPKAVVELLEGSVDAAVVLDSDRRLLYFNRAYEAITGLRGGQILRKSEQGARCFELFELEICKSGCLGCRALEKGSPLRMDEITATRHSDGELLTLIVTSTPIDGRFIVESYRDVTAEARVQRRLKELLEKERHAKADLEEQVAARTKELRQAHAQLVHQEKMSSLGRLVAGIAHELNNPINFIYGNVDYLGRYVDDLLALVEKVQRAPQASAALVAQIEQLKQEIEFEFISEDCKKLLKAIHAGAERSASIISDLKTFSRSGPQALQPMDVVAGVETSLNLINHMLKNRIAVERDYQEKLPQVITSPGRLNQVLMNILTNAAQAIEGEGTIRITARQRDEALEVGISDTGCGIPEEVLQKITEPFFTTKEEGKGTGLGLWITESILRDLGGAMAIRSEVGRGTTFTITIPIKAPSDGG